MGEIFNKVVNQFKAFWGGLEKKDKTRIILASVLAVVLVGSFVFYASRPQLEILYENLSKTAAGEIMANLKDKGVKARLNGTTISVPKGQADQLQAQLAVEGIGTDEISIPEQQTPSSVFDTSEDKRQRYIIAKQNKIKKGLSAIRGVEYVDVNVVIPESNTFVLSDNKEVASASLLIKMKDNAAPLNRDQVNGIVQFVAKSVQGLQPENISIMDDLGNSLVVDESSVSGQISTQMDMQNKTQEQIESSIRKFLEAPFGVNNVKISAAVKLDFNSEVTNSTTYIPTDEETKTGIVKSMQKVNKDWVGASDGGVPGTDTNIDVPQYSTTTGSGDRYTEASDVINYDISEIKKNIVKQMGNIQTVTISVILNKTALKQDALANPEQLTTDVQDLVKSALQGFTSSDLTLNNGINVKIMAFDTKLADDITKAKADEAKLAQRDMYIKIGAAVAALLVFGIVMFLFLRRRKPDLSTAAGQAAAAAAGAIPQAGMPTLEQMSVAEIELEDKNEIKKKLEKFVGQKPDAVAQLLKSWINEE